MARRLTELAIQWRMNLEIRQTTADDLGKKVVARAGQMPLCGVRGDEPGGLVSLHHRDAACGDRGAWQKAGDPGFRL